TPVESQTWAFLGDVQPAHAARLATTDRPNIMPIVVERRAGDVLVSMPGRTAKAPDTVSSMDAVVTMIPDQKNAAQHVEFRFVNFDAEQARGFVQSAEAHAPDALKGNVHGVVEPPNEPNALAAFAGGKKPAWDPAHATATESALAQSELKLHAIEIPAR